MKKNYTKEEKDAWLRGKIAGYYSHKARMKRDVKSKANRFVPKYSNFDANDALEAALKRTYDTFKNE